MATPDFSKILSMQAQEIEKPDPVPEGSYICNNPALPKFHGVGKESTPCADFALVILQPGEDVDADAIASFEKDGKRPLKGRNIRLRLFMSDNSLHRSKEELIKGFGLEEEGKSLGMLFNETINRQVLAHVKHRPSEDGTQIYAEVDSVTPL